MRRLICLLLLALATPASAHHSLAGYDASRPIDLDGFVTEFHFTQPHPFLTIKAAGNTVWKLEMDNLYELDEIGISSTTFKAGDHVTAHANPSRFRPGDAYLRRLDRASDGLRYEQVGSSPRLSYRPK